MTGLFHKRNLNSYFILKGFAIFIVCVSPDGVKLKYVYLFFFFWLHFCLSVFILFKQNIKETPIFCFNFTVFYFKETSIVKEDMALKSTGEGSQKRAKRTSIIQSGQQQSTSLITQDVHQKMKKKSLIISHFNKHF